MGNIFQPSASAGILYWLYCVASLLLVVRVVLNNRNPVKTLAWVMVLLFLPFLGLVLYFFFGRDTRQHKYIGRRSLTQIQQRSHLYYRSHESVETPAAYAPLVAYLENSASAYPMPGSEVRVIADTTLFARELLAAIEAAERHVHIQFYIFENDEFGRRVRDALVAKARSGVEVRLIYDSVGSWRVPRSFFEEIRFAGGQVEAFLKVRFPVFGSRVNYRNHRKVVVVDGKLGFVGGCNIADRYIKGINGGSWRDTMLSLRGGAVHGLQTSFLIDWYFANGSLVSGGAYFPPCSGKGGAVVQVAQSNPVGGNRVIMSALVMMLAATRSYAYVQTPYLMLNDTVALALKNAAVAGVDVRLMIPLRADSRVADYATYSYLGELLEAGVKVYLYEKGFMHSKAVVCDDAVSTVGSTNLDFRSFFYNFECNAFVYDTATAVALKAQFLEDQKACRALTLREYSQRSFARRCVESAARLFSPLL